MDEKSAAADGETDQPYELDLDDGGGSSIDEVFEEALASVDREDEDLDTSEDTEPPLQASEDASQAGRAAVLEKELAELRDLSVRTMADFDNFRKRSEREKASLKRYALFDPLKDFLGVADNLERALAAGGTAEDLKLGVEMTVRQLSETLRRHGVEPVEAVGKAFDPTVHEAVSRLEMEDLDGPTVIEEMQRGYLLHDRLLRPAMVAVGMPVKGSAKPGSDGSAEEREPGK